MLELRILVDDIDYDSIAEYLIPAVAEKLRREEKGGILGNVLAGNPDVAASVARTVLGTMSQEQKDPAARPRIAGQPLDLSQYGTIYLGYPIWWGTAPRIINTFLDTYDLTGKTIRPFCTSGSSGIIVTPV